MMRPSFKFYFAFLLLFLLLTSNLFAKDFDTTLEKPDIKNPPDKHRIFLHLLSGDGSMVTPAKEEIRGSDNAATVASFAEGSPSITTSFFGSGFGPKEPTVTSTGQSTLEYRYLDKFRVFYENRKITQDFTYGSIAAGAVSLSNIPVKYTDSQKRFGVAYFLPVLSMLNFGVSLRHVELHQATNSTFGSARTQSFLSGNQGNLNRTSVTSTYVEYFDQSVKMTGYVPGFGFEFKPLSWFEIHIQHLIYNLKGNDTRNNFAYAAVSSLSVTGISLGDGNATYRGYSQTIDFVFRYSSWFATRWGYTRENFIKTNGVFSFSNLDSNPASAIASSLFLQALSEANVKYGSYNITIEFSKGFGGSGQ